MHNIISTGLPGSTTKNIRMLNILAGAKEIRHVTLVVIGLDTVESRASKRRVKELKVQWRNMLSSRSAVELFDGTKKGSHDILNRVLEKEQTIVLNIQREIVDQKLDLSGTAAGRLVRKEIEKLQAEVRHELDRRCRDMKGALYSEDEELAAIRELRNWFGRRLQELEDQKAPLLPSYERAQNQASQQELSDAHLSSSRSLLETSVKLIQRILRPKVPTGHRRLEWLCVSHLRAVRNLPALI
jgi:ribosome recycling factor